jgi:hypothetical protein
MNSQATDDLASKLPRLLPQVIAWADAQASLIQRHGQPLNSQELRAARAVSVLHPERIRMWTVQQILAPEDPELKQLALEQNLIGPRTKGLTLAYGILILEGHHSPQLLSHECRHVHQVEVAGGLAAFLPHYLQQIAEFGYDNAPYELDAREHELSHWP